MVKKMGLRNYLDKLKKYFWFSVREWRSFVLVVAVLAVIASWGDWGRFSSDLGVVVPDVTAGLKNLFVALILMTLVVFVHHAAQRLSGLYFGFKVKHRLWWHGLLIGLILVMVSGGDVKFLAATASFARMLPVHRLGHHKYGANISTLTKVMIVGPLANVLFAFLTHSAVSFGLLSSVIGTKLFTLNIWFAVCNLLPIPQLDGSYILFFSRPLYVILFGSVAAYGLLAVVYDFWSFALAVVVGGLLGALFYWILEVNWKGGS